MAQSSHVLHEIHPVFNTDSRILILGSFPSVKSRESQFFYGHPRNRFWDLLATLTGEPLPAGIEEKKSLLLAHHIAVWDVIASCDIEGSSDSSIRNVVPNDIRPILETADIWAWHYLRISQPIAWQFVENAIHTEEWQCPFFANGE